MHSPSKESQELIANLNNRSHSFTKTPRRTAEKSPPQDFAINDKGAPILLLTLKHFVTVPKKTTQAVEVNVPVNPASLINVQPLDEGLLDGALPAVYRHKTLHKDKSLVIMYTNLSDQDIIICQIN